MSETEEGIASSLRRKPSTETMGGLHRSPSNQSYVVKRAPSGLSFNSFDRTKSSKDNKLSRVLSSHNSSQVASLLKSLATHTASEQSSETLYYGVDKEEERRLRDIINRVHNRILKRDADRASILHYSACMLDGELEVEGLIRQLCGSPEYLELQNRQIDEVQIEQRIWKNKFHPWICHADDADEELGTVKWSFNEKGISWARWDSGAIEGESMGSRVYNGTFVTQTNDNWSTVAMEQPFKEGIHEWYVKKTSASANGNKARIGVAIRDIELDKDFRNSHFLNRVWYIDEDGDIWNGNNFVARGDSWFRSGSIVRCRLDTLRRTLSFAVSFNQKGDWKDSVFSQAASSHTRGPPNSSLVMNLPPGKELYPVIQDYCAGSGFEVSDICSKEFSEENKKEFEGIFDMPKKFIDELVEKVETAEERKAARSRALSTMSFDTRSVGSRSAKTNTSAGSRMTAGTHASSTRRASRSQKPRH
ncbi:hypothetical protein GUITHDRAFT_106418 [Guillardia theta CCMP2712]|uniref:B30.2/SPRY domain-containing protein n=1 Tax=Guillardia theta (strain CCMP2712) TaxID=905079 RepID=L1JIA3_GUITC|nr:hypothetical protein GUITHDRAFT_106418 [Guillardia theta CCMP2712]EKX47869.1 hypothetical protein GUITHDRAFT_106418 [Guillardia theta CCMP2712]|mmetsp:Transcript_20937/g.69902  ORF Transcript_20937/g.69902 Transcript_20937/m.69902 type:complete len:476 (-) Transcript_20937:46-1473(-)|eukprot:XP_005834849.1 hypothetical protein GUITHDRAFT_106418 [Guillardia theta CCMP2712]